MSSDPQYISIEISHAAASRLMRSEYGVYNRSPLTDAAVEKLQQYPRSAMGGGAASAAVCVRFDVIVCSTRTCTV